MRHFPERRRGVGYYTCSHENNFVRKGKAASSSQRWGPEPTAGPLMAWKHALIWISLFLSFRISFSENAASESQSVSVPAAFHTSSFYTNLRRGDTVGFFPSRRRRSSSSSCFLKPSFKLIRQPGRRRAARFSAGVITIFCMPGTGGPGNPRRVAPRGFIDRKVFLINSGRAVTGGARRLVAACCHQSCVHIRTNTHTLTHTAGSSVQNAKLHDNKLLCRIWIWIHPSLHNCRAGSVQNTVLHVICFPPKKASAICLWVFF